MAKILLIDNQLLWQRALSKLLQRAGYEVLLAGSYQEAVSRITAAPDVGREWDLILIDLVLDEWTNQLEGKHLLPLIEERDKLGIAKVLLFTEQEIYESLNENGSNALLQHKRVLMKFYDKRRFGDGVEFLDVLCQTIGKIELKADWGEAPDVATLCGRQTEIAALKQAILTDHCRIVAMFGMGGIGKSALLAYVVRQIKDQFEYLFWRDLRNAPPFEEVLNDCLKFLSDQQETTLPEGNEKKITTLLKYLKERRCLLILDNLETILQGGQQTGHYRAGYADYGRLLQRIGETAHQSCLLIGSREQPKEFDTLASQTGPVVASPLNGLQPEEGRELLQTRGISSSEPESVELVQRYSGNPLALKQAAASVQNLFGGDLSAFLQENVIAFGDIRDLLEEQFNRLSGQEQEILYWLAIEREPVSLAEIMDNLVRPPSKNEVLEQVDALSKRSIVESSGGRFYLQPVILEYVTERLISQISQELITNRLNLFMSHALSKAQAKDYVRESQIRLILQPVTEVLIDAYGQDGVEAQLQTILTTLHKEYTGKPGYGGGNVLNLLIHLGISLTGHNFSNLAIWQAYLRNVELHNVNFSYSNVSNSLFSDAFGSILSIAFSLDGNLLAIGTDNKEIYLWQLPVFKQLMILKGHLDWIRSIAISPDSKILASSSDDQTVKIWDLYTGECLKTFHAHLGRVRGIAFSPDGRTLASGSTDQTIKLWDVNSGQCLKSLTGHNGWLWTVVFSPDGNLLASSSEDKTIRLWDVNSGQCLKVLEGHTLQILRVIFNPDGNILASCSHDHDVRLWDVNTGDCIRVLQGSIGPVRSVAFSPDGSIAILNQL